jgi:exopolysaccharide biosynthesis operon protein EpsL
LVRRSVRSIAEAGLSICSPRVTAAAAVAWLIFLFGLTPRAHAQDLDHPLRLKLSTTAVWDANVFRVAPGVADPQLVRGITGKADRYLTATFGLRLDKRYAQQQFIVDLGGTATRYDKFTTLDRDAFNNRAQWNWFLTPRISGTLSAEHVDSVVGFEDITLGRSLIKTTTDTQRFTVDGWLFGGWHLLAGFSRSEYVNSQAFAAIPGTRQTNREVGVRYVAASGSSMTVVQRATDGVYPGQNNNLGSLIDNRFTVRETELNAAWIASMRSTLNGRLTWLERRYQGPTGLDFSGLAGEVRYSWTPTGRLTVDASAFRTLMPFFQPGSSYRVDEIISIAPTWRVTDKVTLGLRVNRMVSDYLGPVAPIAGPLRSDTTRIAALTASWQAHRKLTLGASVLLDRRQSNFAIFDYETTVASLTASLNF